ncbi:hypothetical protein [Streptomyces sp. NPDC058757]|uniref:hypothetical protein n=1 Tax=Streptomyces sp. NPDC058757 TaxID=3346626 RepID=UPI00367B6729
MSRLSPAHLRMAGLGTAVAIAVLVPLAAKAGGGAGTPPRAALPAPADAKPADAKPADPGSADPGSADPGSADPGSADPGSTDPGVGGAEGGGPDGGGGGSGGELLGGLGLGREAGVPGGTPPSPAAPVRGEAAAPAGAPERISRCGPEVAAPEGVEAQTCVLSEGPDVWARTYYRNATGRKIDAILTLMAPGGRTVQVRCAVPARDEPGTCETPEEPGAGAASAYTAVAEFAESDEGGDAPLLLRSGSNTADDEAS